MMYINCKIQKITLALGLMMWCCVAVAQTMNINGRWKFYLAKETQEAEGLANKEFYDEHFDDAAFDNINVPSCWAILGYEEPVYRGYKKQGDVASEGFYRHHFEIPKSMAGKRMLLHFGGVWASAEVWLNGKWVGRHDSGYTSFALDISDCAKAGKDNLLAVRVRQVYPGYRLDTYDDWTLGGIYRDVEIEAMPAKRRIDRVRVDTKMNGELTVKVMVADEHKNTLPGNYMSPGKPYKLRLTITDNKGNVVEQMTRTDKGHPANSREQKFAVNIHQPRLWSAETPYLYTLTTELLEDDQVSHVRQQKVGIREITTDGGVFRINGVAVKLRGVNHHDEHPDVGRATTREHWLNDLKMMKEANINYIRAAHYQHAKGLIEMCDSIGMYVGSEISLGGTETEMYNPAYIAPMMLRTIETVERDINNPSVIYWSIGNEDAFTDQFLTIARTLKGLDPSRPLLIPWNADETLPEEIDILSVHYWTAQEYDSLAARAQRPIISTEYVHAYGNQRMGGLEDCWNVMAARPAAAGGAVWMWAEQGLRTPTKKDRKIYNSSLAKDDDHLRLNPEGWDGIVDSYRNITRDYLEVKAVYCPVGAEYKDGRLLIHNNYDFTNLNTVSIEWQSFVDGKQMDNGKANLSAAPHSCVEMKIATRKPYDYLWLTFKDSQGREIGRKSVDMTVATIDDIKAKYAVDANKAGALDDRILKAFRPTIWHKLNDGDQIIKNRKGLPNIEKYTEKVVSLDTIGNAIHKKAVYEVNDSNWFEATIVATFYSGATTIQYAITPHLQTNYVPIVGMAYNMKNAKTLRHWFGLGPHDAYPNKKAACLLGLWDAQDVSGTHAMRWVEADGLRIYCDGWLDRDSPDSKEIRLLSHVLGRSEKGRLNYPEYQLPQGNTYKGEIVVVKK